MYNPSGKSIDGQITELFRELLSEMNESEKKKMYKELEMQRALAEAEALKGSVKKNTLKMQDFVSIVRKVRKQHGWNIA